MRWHDVLVGCDFNERPVDPLTAERGFQRWPGGPNPGLARHVGMGGSGGSEMYYYYIIEFSIDIIIHFTATAATTSKRPSFLIIAPQVQ